MPEDKKIQNSQVHDLPVPQSTPAQSQVVHDTSVEPPTPKIDEQASLNELAEKLAKWKKQVSNKDTDPIPAKGGTSAPLQDMREDGSTGDSKGSDPIPTQGGTSVPPKAIQEEDIVEIPVETTEEPIGETVQPVSSGISVTPEDVTPYEDNQDSVKQFEKEVQEATVVKSVSYPKDIRELLKLAYERGSSDLHVTVGYPPIFRIDGKLVHIGTELVTLEMAEKLIFPVLTESKRDLLEVNREVDVAYEIDDLARFRVNVYHEKGRLAAAFRLIPERIKTIEELNLPKILRRFTKLNQGFILVTGPTGHGKTTTLASLIQEINKNYDKHIITIEDPIEYVYPRAKALVTQREMHEDTHSWEIALRSAMREDPDVVLVGEMRDHETISSAITLAETGHLVFATLHTNSASQTVDRIIDSFPDNQQRQVRSQLATIIEGVVCQRLIPVRTGGRRPACEIMLSTPAVKNLIREGKVFQIDNVIRTSLDVGMTSMENSLVQLVREGLISVEQAEEYATEPEEVIRLLR